MSDAASAAPACTTTITGTHPTVLKVTSGVTCLQHATQNGGVTVGSGAALVVTSSTVNGIVTAAGAASITYCGSTQRGGVAISGTSGGVTLGGTEPDASSCAPDTIPSSITISGTAGPVTVSGLKENGTLTLSGNTGGVTLNGINLSGRVTVAGNTGTAPVTVSGNTIAGSLSCTGNTPAPGDNGAVNVVSGTASGQCAPISSRTPVPHTGPTLANIEPAALAYAAGSPPEPVTSTLTVSSSDATTLAGATVSITAGLVADQDALGFGGASGITGSYDASTGVLTLTGTASLASYQAALRSVTYRDSNAAAATGTRTISFRVNDGAAANNLSNIVSRSVSVTAAPPGPPVANNDTARTDKNTAINIDVLANDTDPAGRALTVASVDTTGTKGTVTVNSDNTIHYDPNGQFASLQAGQTATDTFSYTATDGTQTSNSATVTVTVTGTNTAPVIASVETVPLSYPSGSPAVAVTSTLTVSDADDGTLSGATVSVTAGLDAAADTLGFTNASGITGSYDASTGVLTLTGAASLASYQAALRTVTFATTDPAASPAARTVSFTVTDSVGATSAAATRTIDVSPGAQAPTANSDSYDAVGNTPLGVGTTPSGPAVTESGSVLANDTDPNAGGTLSVTSNTQPAHGSVTVNPDGTFTYLPAAGFTGADTFSYTETDSASGKTATGTVTVTVATLVWYVDDSKSAAGNGEGPTPFNTLAAAASAAGPDSIVFLYQGSGAYSGGFTMKSGQELLGQPHGLTVSGHSLVAAGGANPVIGNSGGNGIELAPGTDIEDVTVSGASGNGIDGSEVTGTVTLAGVTVSGSGTDNVLVTDTSGSLNLGVTGSAFTGSAGNYGFDVNANGSTSATVSVTGSTFTNNASYDFEFGSAAGSTGTNSVTFSGNTVTGGGGVLVGPLGGGSTAVTIDSNNIQNPADEGIGVDNTLSTDTGGSVTGTISGNTVGTAATANSGGGFGIGIGAEGSFTTTLTISNNQLFQYSNPTGINFIDREGSPALNLTITGNTIADPGQFGSWGILGTAGAQSGDAGTVCAAISGNSVKGSAAAGQGGADIEIDQQFATTVKLPGYTGAAGDTSAVQSFLQGNNTGNGTPSVIATVSGSGGGFTGGTC
jgi:VCBS repeat-containing protein